MDDLDKFLEESGVTIPAHSDDRSLSLEKDDDFMAFLDSAAPLPNRTGDEEPLATKAIEDGQDFLDWLQQDSPRKKSVADPEQETRAWSPNASFIETSKHLHTDIKDVSRESMDSFFNDVFGSPSPSSKQHKSLDAVSEGEEQSYDEQVLSIVQSSFPDIQQLKRIICEAGYIPNKLRAQVWALLLNESCVEDEEARHYHTEGVEFENQQALVSDCSAVIASATVKLSAAEAEVLRKDMHDILALYCQRRSIAYSTILCRLLSPLLVVPERASRTMSSSCFYTLASDFIPLINLNPVAYQLGASVSHTWLRMLLSYHSPALVQHLDRVLPHWQEPAAEVSAHQSARNAATQKRNIELDELERELGLDILDDMGHVPSSASTTSDGAGSNPGQVHNKEPFIESALPNRDAGHGRHGSSSGNMSGGGAGRSGCVPTHWITGIFTGSLPPDQSALLLDWAIVNNSPFAGLYFTAALLEVFSQSLLKMSGPHIRQWLEDVAMNKAEWYRQLSVSVPLEVEKSVKLKGGSDAKFLPDTWMAFMTGWIHCTRALIRSTPQAFKDGLDNTAQWAQLRSELRPSSNATVRSPKHGHNGSNRMSMDLDKQAHGHASAANNSGTSAGGAGAGNHMEEDSGHNSHTTGDDSGAEEEDEGHEDDYIEDSIFDSPNESARSQGIAAAGDGSAQQGSSFGTTNFMAQFRRLSAHLYNDSTNAAAAPRSPGKKLLLQFPQERAYSSKYAPICLTASAEEVVPCICSNRRRATVPDDLIRCFYTAAFSLADPESAFSAPGSITGTAASTSVNTPTNVLSPHPSVQSPQGDENRPFYFGIDCRSTQERELGQFPKAYAFDPADLAEAEEVSKLLDMVETMAASAHLCLIGAGDEFLRWSFQQSDKRTFSRSSRTKGDAPELLRNIEESHSRLNAVAMFFLKRSFKHISILDGGFMAAVKYLQAPDSPLSLTAALVDCNRPALESLLGIHSTAPPPAAKRDSIVGFLAETTVSAPSKLLSVGTYFTHKNTSGSSAAGPVVPAATVNTSLPSAGSSGNLTADSVAAVPADAPHAAVPVASDATPAEGSKLFSSWGKKISMLGSSSLETLKKGVATVSVVAGAAGLTADASTASTATAAPSTSSTSKTISDGYESDDGLGPKEIPDTTKINISRTEKERENALSLHKMAGLRKGDRVMINRVDLPGAILFPSIKYKTVMVDVPSKETAAAPASTTTSADASAHATGDSTSTADGVATSVSACGGTPLTSQDTAVVPTVKVPQQIQVHRYLVVSRERFIVLDASGGGVGSEATVKSNRHLTELMKMTFKKKDPELVTLFFVSPEHVETGKARQYRVSKRQEFVTALQKNMERFR